MSTSRLEAVDPPTPPVDASYVDVRARLENIYDRYYARIYRFCLYRLYSREVAEDATSAVFLSLAERFGSVGVRDETAICKWLYGTARNAVSRHRRIAEKTKEAAAKLAHQGNGQLGKPSGSFEQLDWPVLHSAMLKLKPKEQDMLVLRYFEGMQAKEVAAVLGMKPVAVRVAISRSIKKLRRSLSERFGE